MFNLFNKPNAPKLTSIDEMVFDNLLVKIGEDTDVIESLLIPVVMLEQYFKKLVFEIASNDFNLNGEVYSKFTRSLFFSFDGPVKGEFSSTDINTEKIDEILSVISRDSALCDLITHTSNIISFIHMSETDEDEKEDSMLVLAKQRGFLIHKNIYNTNIVDVDVVRYFTLIKEFFREFSPESIRWKQ